MCSKIFTLIFLAFSIKRVNETWIRGRGGPGGLFVWRSTLVIIPQCWGCIANPKSDSDGHVVGLTTVLLAFMSITLFLILISLKERGRTDEIWVTETLLYIGRWFSILMLRGSSAPLSVEDDFVVSISVRHHSGINGLPTWNCWSNARCLLIIMIYHF
jgi:hypothetical protein